MNRSLLNQGAKRLRKAGDADQDPAIVAAPSQRSGGNASAEAGGIAGEQGGDAAIPSGSHIASDSAVGNADSDVARNTSGNARLSTGGKARIPGSGNSSSRISLGRPPRKRGRPAGPARVALNVRLLLTTDDVLSEIGETMGVGPQEVTEAAILHYAAYLRRTGKLPQPTPTALSADR